ncbi:cobQ/CobB/MinD/ParA nucleotide binding domain protein [archaeon BMS3Abin16]|nr:cobQ/CobB/MinD/ParA nucleotide binding domain protein [archaeon BMS3Abin16]HDY74606.1 ATP-binding protein [Euryarchaeota archaeon]
MLIAVSGKGGVGKTMLSALLVKVFSDENQDLLAIDADPDSNLPDALGIKVEKTIGDVREEILESRNRSPGKTLHDVLEYHTLGTIEETDNFDLLAMGRPEGSGCYCAVNHMLREIIDKWAKGYKTVVIDTEAGLEHLSRRTTQDVDTMIVVTDTSKRGIETAKRIKNLAADLDIDFKKLYVVINRADPGMAEGIKKELEAFGLEVLGAIPEDRNVLEFDYTGRPLPELPPDSPALVEILKIKDRLTGAS